MPASQSKKGAQVNAEAARRFTFANRHSQLERCQKKGRGNRRALRH
jgi:hypothetical protein